MGKHSDLPRSDMDRMTPQEKADTFDSLHKQNEGKTPDNLTEQWNQSVKRRGGNTDGA